MRNEVACTGALQAGVELLLGALLVAGLEPGVQLGAQGVLVPGIAVSHRRFERLLRMAVVIDIGGVKISAACRDEPVHHFAHLGDVGAPVLVVGQAHQAEA